MASVAIEEATGDSTGGGEGERSLLCRFEVEAATFGSSEDLFVEALLPRVFTMVASLNKAKEKYKSERKGQVKFVRDK